MYKLTLTREERKAIDWVGHRYSHGHDLYDLLIYCPIEGCKEGDADEDSWESDAEITYLIPEHIAWKIQDNAKKDNNLWPLFAPELKQKMIDFCNKIV